MRTITTTLISAALLAMGCGGATEQSSSESTAFTDSITTQSVTYQAVGDTAIGYAAYPADTAKKPAVLVVHEWWGLDDYTKRRTNELAELGYVAFAVDMYGQGRTAGNPEEAMALAGPNYQDPQAAKQRFDAALAQLKSLPGVDTTRIAAIGYCFGGSMVLNAVKLGDQLQAAVSFHGGLKGVPADKTLLTTPILICHGAEDANVPESDVTAFKAELDSIGADYVFKEYPGATHAFTNPEATETGKKFNLPIAYNAEADTASWNDMKAFFEQHLH
ncbi:dienelactone hydrolase family protein [Parapedobacter koreensis]|uniref:Dienelactone hydrolase n=1 Tax=Parapedobacter koreensis TaxID=332977 RepID=A0A1H7LTR2_9SPHI|nr:dienelactone hydrolase family protein [Parapedobacter koreensis]SEL02098.1 Dienelactone hydrolase [Parapedobacter koreensis]